MLTAEPPGIEGVLAAADTRVRRLDPIAAAIAIETGSHLVDTRPEFQRRADGELPGAIVIERNHLEWRLDPAGSAAIPEAVDHDVAWIICCDEGYSSRLAVLSLLDLGLRDVADVVGGFQAWRAAGLPVLHPDVPERPRLHEDPAFLR